MQISTPSKVDILDETVASLCEATATTKSVPSFSFFCFAQLE